MPQTSFNTTGTPGYGSYGASLSIPSFQDIMGQSPTDLISFLTGQKLALMAPELASRKELAGMGYKSAADIAGMGYKSAADLQREQITAQKVLQAQAAQQAIDQAREQFRLNQIQGMDQLNQQGLLGVLADAAKRRNEASMWSAPFHTISSPANRRNFGYAGFGGTVVPTGRR